MTIAQYLTKINRLRLTGTAREHSYRGDLQNLIMAILPDVLVINESKRIECGSPDLVLNRKDISVGYIEAKDVGQDLKDKKLKEQFDRYKSGLSNLIFTDYLDFHFYHYHEFITSIRIAEIDNGAIIPITENFDQFTNLIVNFSQAISQTIKSPTKLAELMAGKARLMADVIEKSLDSDDATSSNSTLKSQMHSFRDMLIHDIDNKAFSDIYAQTIAYGMFAARYHDPTLPTFSRQEAATLIPKSNPFLRKLFQDIAGYDLDDRLVWIVEELVSIFLATDVSDIMKNFGRSTKQEDPVVHFYETFLASYNPALRKARGVWYTPQPVVNFIVRAVDDILKTEFNLKDGLADTSKIKIKVKQPKLDNRSKSTSKIIGEEEVEQEVHRIQILDPATGTGTFLAEVVRHIHKKFKGQEGIWSKYVANDLIPRLNGFELLMASYAMAHLKMDMLFTETGYKPKSNQRFRIFLTNSLEEHHPDTGTLWASALADEANQANAIKRDAPVMVVMGNPPYSGESANKSEWIMNLMEDYKKEPGGKEKLKERNPKWINDDYVKFLRFGQHFIDKNGSGVLAFINPHGFLDNPTFRGMRWNLLKTYDKIYTIDLHGNSKKKEVSPDGSVDQNVFDIMQGVSINLFVKTGKSKKDELAEVFHYDLFGKREFKYRFLSDNRIATIPFIELPNISPNYFFVNKNFKDQNEYNEGFDLNQLFSLNNVGIVTAKDLILINDSEENLINNVHKFYNIEPQNELIHKISYRLFDDRYIYYDTKLLERPREKVMQHLLDKENLAINLCKQFKSGDNYQHIFISKRISESSFVSNKTSEITTVLPLYIYSKSETESFDKQLFASNPLRIPNLNQKILDQIATGLGLTFTPEKETEGKVCFANSPEIRPEFKQTFAPIDLLDYIYAVLHSPSYREKYKEFLKIDFPRIPYPTDAEIFWKLVAFGGELRQLHLLESETVENYITQYPIDGNNVVDKPKFVISEEHRIMNPEVITGRVFINEKQYFDGVPKVVWDFYIGGYQPAQKWLKDRKGRELNYDDILHYQKMILALSETERVMGEIDGLINSNLLSKALI
jgi:predicted helicase